jgi:hypothetical protein
MIKGPVSSIPEELKNSFTMNHQIQVVYNFHNDNTDALLVKEWSDDYLKSYITRFTKANILNNAIGNEPYQKGDLFETEGGASYYHCKVFDKYNLQNKKVAIVGSTTPWLEAIIYNYGCRDITTVEYNKPVINSEIFKSVEYQDFANETDPVYDMIISYSSIEHSGLGRYGDILDPNGDLNTVKSIHANLKNDGLFILGVPIGLDTLVWNANRIYGEKRLPMLIQNFEILEWFGGNANNIYNIPMFGGKFSPQPIIICKKI